jgi:hypothetical protein
LVARTQPGRPDGRQLRPGDDAIADGSDALNGHLHHVAGPQRGGVRSPAIYGGWERTANDRVTILRGEAGRNPDKALSDLIGELPTRSEKFRTHGAAHKARLYRRGIKTLHYPVVGDLERAGRVGMRLSPSSDPLE